MKKQKEILAFVPVPGGGVTFPFEKPNSKEETRINLIVRVDRAVIAQDRAALARLQRECKDIPLLKDKIKKAMEG